MADSLNSKFALLQLVFQRRSEYSLRTALLSSHHDELSISQSSSKSSQVLGARQP